MSLQTLIERYVVKKKLTDRDVIFIDMNQVNLEKLAQHLQAKKLPGLVVGIKLGPNQTMADKVQVIQTSMPTIVFALRDLMKAYEDSLLPGEAASDPHLNLAKWAMKKAGLQ